MAIDRRTFLTGITGITAITAYTCCAGQTMAGTDQDIRIFATGLDEHGYVAAGINTLGDVLFTWRLPGRGHGIAVSPDRKYAVVFARRPGRWVLVIDLLRKRDITMITSPPGRHFFGHGVFSANGQYLYATENDYDNEQGIVAVYDFTNIHIPVRTGEFSSGGVGPHEIILLRDKQTLVVANGGILTHPDYRRQKLNLASMAPNIAAISIPSGNLKHTCSLPPRLHQLSMRHIAEGKDGTIWWAAQYEGPQQDTVPLAGRYNVRTRELLPLPDKNGIFPALKQYTGSISVSTDHSRVAITSPRGGKIVIWDTDSFDLRSAVSLDDVCGLGATGSDFVVSSGTGRISALDGSFESRSPVSWDNHLTAL